MGNIVSMSEKAFRQKIANFATKRKLIIEFSNNLSTIIKKKQRL